MLMSEVYRTYEFKHFANKGKIEKIKAVLKEYRKTAQNIANYLWMEFFRSGGNLPHKKKISVNTYQAISLKDTNTCVCGRCMVCCKAIFPTYKGSLQTSFGILR